MSLGISPNSPVPGDELRCLEQRLCIDKLDDALYFPQFFQIETIRHCNARCPFCAVDQWDMSTPLMDDWLFDKIAEELGAYREWVRIVDIQRAGEPLLDKKLPARIRRMKDVGMRFVNISTNASLLDAKRGLALLEAGIDEVLVSIDSIDKTIYESLRVGLNFDSVVANIRGFFALREQINPRCVIRVRGVATFDVRTPDGAAEVARWTRFWEPLARPGDRVYMKPLHNWGNTHVWNKHEADSLAAPLVRPCIVPWSTFNITSSGAVPLCGQDTDAGMRMGDVRTSTIAEIWRGEGFSRVRQTHSSGARDDISFCRGCTVFDPNHSLEATNSDKGGFHVKPTRAVR